MAARLLCESGIDVLVLDAGLREGFLSRPIDRSITSSVQFLARPAATRIIPQKLLWRAERALRFAGRWRRPIQSACYAWPTDPEGFVDDYDNPYETPTDRPYRWIRARQLGGRMVVPAHGKQYYRHSAADFFPRDGKSPAWPLKDGELDPWYAKVEALIELHGRREGIAAVPDSDITHQIEPNDTQTEILNRIGKRWPDAAKMLGRYAYPPTSLEAAAATGRLWCRDGAVAAAIKTNAQKRVQGVVVHDARTGRHTEVSTPRVFLCASAFESVRILLNSANDRHPQGLGGSSGHLGRHVMDHVSIKLEGSIRGQHFGTAPLQTQDCVFLPRFDQRDGPVAGRGYGVRIYVYPGAMGICRFTAVSDSEMLPNAKNSLRLSDRRDRWGVPILNISCAHGLEEASMAKEQEAAIREIAHEFGAELSSGQAARSVPGSSIHEVGGARMGAEPGASVLDPHCQCWEASGLYVTDGAAFPSIGIQNPTLTILALTARACEHSLASG
ncbi:MAG: GMC family oxidoreductase [Pseudomonadota bacterium]